jgi:hypothetical protein
MYLYESPFLSGEGSGSMALKAARWDRNYTRREGQCEEAPEGKHGNLGMGPPLGKEKRAGPAPVSKFVFKS